MSDQKIAEMKMYIIIVLHHASMKGELTDLNSTTLKTIMLKSASPGFDDY